jgi:hypothetical protein
VQLGIHIAKAPLTAELVAAWRQTRTGSGGLGLYAGGPSGTAASDGGIEGRCRDGPRIVPQSRSREPQLARGVAGRALFHHQPDAHLKIFGYPQQRRPITPSFEPKRTLSFAQTGARRRLGCSGQRVLGARRLVCFCPPNQLIQHVFDAGLQVVDVLEILPSFHTAIESAPWI